MKDIATELASEAGHLPNWARLKDAIQEFSRPADQQGFDMWPFNEDGDGLSPLAEVRNNCRLAKKVVVEVATAIEYLAMEISGLSSESKLEKAVAFLAPMIFAKLTGAKFLIRPVVKPLLRHIITAVVDWMNRNAGTVEPGRSFIGPIEMPDHELN